MRERLSPGCTCDTRHEIRDFRSSVSCFIVSVPFDTTVSRGKARFSYAHSPKSMVCVRHAHVYLLLLLKIVTIRVGFTTPDLLMCPRFHASLLPPSLSCFFSCIRRTNSKILREVQLRGVVFLGVVGIENTAGVASQSDGKRRKGGSPRCFSASFSRKEYFRKLLVVLTVHLHGSIPTPTKQPTPFPPTKRCCNTDFAQEYFHNATTTQTTWDRPTAPAAPKAAPPLPSKPSGEFFCDERWSTSIIPTPHVGDFPGGKLLCSARHLRPLLERKTANSSATQPPHLRDPRGGS